METKVTTHKTIGFIIALILIVINIIAHLLGFDLEKWFGWVVLSLFFIAIVWCVINHSKQMNFNVTFGNLFAFGFKITAVVICITFLYTLLSVYLIFPDSIDKIVQKGIEQAIQDKKMTEDQVQQAMPMIKKITTITIFAGTIIINAIIGALASLLGAAIAKKKPQDPFTNQPV